MNARASLRDGAILVLVTAVYFLAGKLGLSLAFVNASASAVWPPTAIALTAFLLLGYRAWPAILLGAFLVNLTTIGAPFVSFSIGIGNTLEGLAGAFLVNRWASGRYLFARAKDFFLFVFWAGLVSTVISATVGVTSLALGGLAHWSDYGAIWLTWWLGDATGAIIITPLLILWSQDRRVDWNRREIFEVGLLLLVLLLTGLVVFGGMLPTRLKNSPLAYICIPPLIWTAFWFRQREAATAVFVLSGIAIWGTLHGFGPFVRGSQNESLLFLQAFMAVIGMMTLALAAVVSERRRAEGEVRALNDHLEGRVRERTAQLEAVNKELEAFSYSVSHDLRAPLRRIRDFSRILLRDHASRLDGAAKDCLGYVAASVQWMEQLIEGMLNLSQITSREVCREAVDLSALARSISEEFKKMEPERRVVFQIEDGLVVEGDARLLRTAIVNLFENAWKFTGKCSEARIGFGSKPNNGHRMYYVSDNGTGFDMAYANRLFGAFQRLHRAEEFSGTGVGLATVQRIIHRHGGRIWAEAAVEKGATFFFTFDRTGGAARPRGLHEGIAESSGKRQGH